MYVHMQRFKLNIYSSLNSQQFIEFYSQQIIYSQATATTGT